MHLKVAMHAPSISNAVEMDQQGASEPLSLALGFSAQQKHKDVALVLLQ